MTSAVFDLIADRYDETRGGELRGDFYAEELHRRLDTGARIVEIGVGTGVVALGLQNRGHRVIGIDISVTMLTRARRRIGDRVAAADACRLPFGPGALSRVVAVWVIHTLANQAGLFREVARVLRPDGRFLVCPENRAAPDDVVGQTCEELGRRVSEVKGEALRPAATAEQILDWACEAGLDGHIEEIPGQFWWSTREQEIRAILERSWSDLVTLDDDQFQLATSDALETLRELPDGPLRRHALAEIVVLKRTR